MNNQLLVHADNLHNVYKVFLAPFSTPTYCTPSITDLGNNNIQCAFVYAVMTPRNSSSPPYFVYNCIDVLYNNVVGRYTFINNGSSCAYQHTNAIVPGNYSTQDNFVIGVDYEGSGIYAFADDFTAYYDFQSLQITSWPNTLPISPRMVDFTSGYGVLVGYCQLTVSQAFECGFIVLVNGSSSSPNNGSVFSIGNSLQFAWSDPRRTHFIASSEAYSTVDLMSVGVAPSGRVLIGIRALNTVLLYIVTNPMNFSTINPLSTRQTGENLMGFGRSVEWLDTDGDKAVIIANQYTYSTNQWISSAFHVYDIESDGFSDQTNPILIYPNSQQMIGPLMNPSFIRLVSDQLSGNIAILDLSGDAVIILSAAPGTYATTNQPSIFSIAVPCIPGTYRDYAGIELCTPCPNGTTSTSSKINCTTCTSSDVFCPYGAVAEVPYTAFDPIVQEQYYPESPESTVFDDILMQNMFSLNTQSPHCLVVSPITWVLVVFGFGSIVLISMGISTLVCPGTHPVRDQAKRVFKKMDLIGEGEVSI
jgi:hypothetical protein